MKLISFVLCGLLVLSVGCGSNNQSGFNEYSSNALRSDKLTVNILYKQKVGEYDVRVECLIDTVNSENVFLGYNYPETDNAIRGESTLRFVSVNDSFEVKLPDFTEHGLYNNTLPLSDGMTIEAEYTPYKPTANNEDFLLLTNSPFFFFDIDFDGEEELLINSYDTFLKGHSEFTIYKRSENRILTEPPYDAITDYTQIDTVNRLLHIPHVNAGEMCTAPGYVSYRIEREVKYDNSHNFAIKNVYKPYRLETWLKDNIYKTYEIDGKTISYKGIVNKVE